MNLLSVVMPVYNEEKFVELSIQRVLAAESCGLDIELIVVDDCSQDGTPGSWLIWRISIVISV